MGAPWRGSRRSRCGSTKGWLEARLGPVPSDDTWVQWVLEWPATAGDHRITVRATDGDGEIQTAEKAPPAPTEPRATTRCRCPWLLGRRRVRLRLNVRDQGVAECSDEKTALAAASCWGPRERPPWAPRCRWIRDRWPGRDRARWRPASDPAGTTLELTVVGSGGSGYQRTGEGQGEPTLLRSDLQVPAEGREDRRRSLAAFVHFTDSLLDAQSPGSVGSIRSVRPSSQRSGPRTCSTTRCRPRWSSGSTGWLGPVGGRAFDAVVCTGDNVDNQQRNELRWFIDILDGGRIVPDSGQIGAYQGVRTPSTGALATGPIPASSTLQGPPRLPRRRRVARLRPRTVRVAGPRRPVVLRLREPRLQRAGQARRSGALDEVFAGDRKMVGLPAGQSGLGFVLRVMGDSPSVLADLRRPDRRTVVADDGRRTRQSTTGSAPHLHSPPVGTATRRPTCRLAQLYHEFELAPGVVGISLDTTNHAGGPNGAGGSIGEEQARWLERRLAAHHRRFLAPDGTEVRSAGDDRLVIVFSHHTAATMDATDADPARPAERRLLGDEVVSILLRYPNVVAWVNGHTHTNEVTPRRHPQGLASGFWEISTASHVDWPQQARVLELIDNDDGTLSIFGTMIEHLGPAAVDLDASDHVALSALARELGLNDAQAGPAAKQGSPLDRNVELVLPAPFVDPLAPPTTTGSTSVPVVATPTPVAPPAEPIDASPAYTG
ncbi:MAG: TIGR03767 family metallophosphoesterase [Acidimicrobiales bacterium]